ELPPASRLGVPASVRCARRGLAPRRLPVLEGADLRRADLAAGRPRRVDRRLLPLSVAVAGRAWLLDEAHRPDAPRLRHVRRVAAELRAGIPPHSGAYACESCLRSR